MSTSIAFDIIARDRASAQFDKVGRSADKSSGKLKKFAKGGALAVGAAAVVAGKALFDMGKMAIADEQAQAVLAKTLRNAAKATDSQVKATESWISAQGKALGVTDDELRPALGRLVAVTKDVGKAQKLTRLAMDISAGSGKSLQTVTTALAKAQTGSLTGLSKLGVATKNAKGETKSLKEITEDLAKTYKGSASTAANTTQGKFNRLKVQFDETKEAIGAKLIPIAGKLADWLLTKVLPAAQKLGGELKEKFGPTFAKIGGFISDKVIPALEDLGGKVLKGLKGYFEQVSKAIEDNRPFIDALVEGYKKYATFMVTKVWPVLGTLIEKLLPAIGKGIRVTITFLRALSLGLVGAAAFGVKAFRFLAGAALASFGFILHAAEKSLGWVPKLGDKIKDAKASFDDFRANTVNNLKKTEDKLIEVGRKIQGIKSPKPVYVGVTSNVSDVTNKVAGLTQRINGIPKSRTITIYANILTTNKGPKTNTDLYGVPTNARGTGYFRGGRTWVGEEGPELVELPRGSRIHDAARSQQMTANSGGEIDYDRLGAAIVRALERGTQLVRLPDAGRAAYQAGAAY